MSLRKVTLRLCQTSFMLIFNPKGSMGSQIGQPVFSEFSPTISPVIFLFVTQKTKQNKTKMNHVNCRKCLYNRNIAYKFKSTLAHQKLPNSFPVELWFHGSVEVCLMSLCAARTCDYAPVTSTRTNILSKNHFLAQCLEKAGRCGKFHCCHRLLGGLASQEAIRKHRSSMPTGCKLGRTIQWHKEIPVLPLCSLITGRNFVPSGPTPA